MIPAANPIPEPPDFDAVCRVPCIAWWAARRLREKTPKTSEFPNLWAKYEADLSRAFAGRCGWWAMWIAEGEVEHFLSKKNRPDLIYEWDNYRYIAGSVNGSKGNHDDKVLDPFEIQDGWFEVILPSMQLIATGRLPAALAIGFPWISSTRECDAVSARKSFLRYHSPISKPLIESRLLLKNPSLPLNRLFESKPRCEKS